MEKNWQLTSSILIVLMFSACSTSPPKSNLINKTTDGRGPCRMALYSRPAPKDHGYEYFLVADLREIGLGAHYVSNLDELSTAFGNLPKNCGIAWRDDRDFHFSYPPHILMERVKYIARRQGVQLLVLPTAYD
jgi:hypothetical protein